MSHCHGSLGISINFICQCLSWCGTDIVIGVCFCQELPWGGWTSAASEVLSHEITDLIESSPSQLPFSTFSFCLHLRSFTLFSFAPLYWSLSVPWLFLYTPSFSYTVYHIDSSPFSPWPCFLQPLIVPLYFTPPLLSPSLPLGQKKLIHGFWVLLKLQLLYVSQPAAELCLSSRGPMTLRVHREETQDSLKCKWRTSRQRSKERKNRRRGRVLEEEKYFF